MEHPQLQPGDCLQLLPDELVLEILACLLPIRGFLDSDATEDHRRHVNAVRIKTLHSLASTNRRLNALSTPFLYRSFVQLPAHRYSLERFLRTVMARPQIIQYLQYIEIQNSNVKVPDTRRLWRLLTNLRLRVGMGDVYGFHLFHQAVATLFGLASNIDELALDGVFNSFVSLEYPGCMSFDRLRRLSLKRNDPDHGQLDLFVSAPVATDHSPVCTYLHAAVGPQMELRRQLGRTRLNPVELHDLSLYNCNMPQAQIDDFLWACTSLKRFTCRWRGQSSPVPPIHLAALREALSRFHQSLEYLELDTLESSWQVTLDEDIPTIGDLRAFSVLKHLDVSGLVLWSDNDTAEYPPLASILPTSLETLAIQVEWDDYVEESLIALSNDTAAQLPNLKTIDCSWRPAGAEIAPLLTNMFKAVGIDLRLIVSEDA